MTEGAQPWRSIDSAPRDGTIIWARQGGYYPCWLRWKDGEWQSVTYNVTHVPTHWLPDGGQNGKQPPASEG